MKRRSMMVAAVLAAATFGAWAPAVAADAAPYCGIRWGSQTKQAEATQVVARLVGVRGGQHTCYDRLVLDFRGQVDGYRVRYVPAVVEDGSGNPVPLRGGARLEVVAQAPAYDEQGEPTFEPANRRELVDVTGWRTFRQVAWAGSFEGQSTVGLGVRARLPFRVLTLDGPGKGSRLVVDVAHQW